LTLKKLSGQKKIIISNARREFVDLEIAQTGIGNFFDHIFSVTSDFNLIKSNHTTFLEVCRICKILPSEMLHIGDDYKFDFKVPRELGIKAIFLDRNGKKKREDTVQSLNQIVIK
jgi:HAD superfamily hydrolase (TIGR01549 family)